MKWARFMVFVIVWIETKSTRPWYLACL